MLRVINENLPGLKFPLYASLALSFASFGDAFLYPFLPQYAEVMQVPVVWIGVLLSVNRVVRIVFNPLVTKLFARYGVKPVTIVASVLAIISTAGYGTGCGLLLLILLRVVWGLAFAILRISALAYAFQHGYAGRSLGMSKSIQEAGPLLALGIGPLLLNYFSITNTFILLGLISVPSLIYATHLPELKYNPVAPGRTWIRIPSSFNSMTFAVSFFAEGILVIVAGLFLAIDNASLSTAAITSLAAGYLAYRRFASILFAPVSGNFADRLGFSRVFHFSLLMIIVGMILLVSGWIAPGLILIFSFSSINSAMAPGAVATGEKDRIRAVSVNATWRDIGAASGTLAGGLLMPGRFLTETFTIAIFILTSLPIIHLRKTP